MRVFIVPPAIMEFLRKQMVEGVDGKIPQPDGKQPRPLRKVAKTLLEQKSPSASLQPGGSAPVPGAPLEAPRKFKKISRTMLEIDVESAAQDMLLHTNVDSPEPQDSISDRRKPSQAGRERFVARTMIDHSMLFQAVSKSNIKMEQKAAEEAIERAKNPVERIEPIVADRKVGKCQWSWPDPFYGKERYRACAICQAGVYDFEGLEREQAEAIVFKRENSKKPKFYARSDGKFMIRDCPKAVARRMQILTLSALAIGFVASLIIAMILMAQPPDLDNTAVPLDAVKIDVDKPSTSESTTLAPGMAHYENGKITRNPIHASEQPDSTTTAPSSNAVPDKGDQMWQDASK